MSKSKSRKGCLWWIAAIFLLIAAAWVVVGFLTTSSCSPKVKTGPEPPAVAEAPWMVDTLTRIYYTKSQPIENGVLVLLDGYYAVQKNRWIYNKDFLELPRKRYGEIKISRRIE